MNTSAEQTEAIRKTMEAEKQASRDELVRELVDALRPIGTFADEVTNTFNASRPDTLTVYGFNGVYIHLGDLRKVQAALRKAGAL